MFYIYCWFLILHKDVYHLCLILFKKTACRLVLIVLKYVTYKAELSFAKTA